VETLREVQRWAGSKEEKKKGKEDDSTCKAGNLVRTHLSKAGIQGGKAEKKRRKNQKTRKETRLREESLLRISPKKTKTARAKTKKKISTSPEENW